MLNPPNNQNDRKKNPPVSELFDDALPSSLKNEGVLSQEEPAVRVHTSNDAPVSPYVIHLSREEKTLVDKRARLDQLANELVTDPELLLDEDERMDAEDDLSIDFEDLAAQLREPDRQIAPVKHKIVKQPQPTQQVQEPSSLPISNAVPTHVREALFKQIQEAEVDAVTKDLLIEMAQELKTLDARIEERTEPAAQAPKETQAPQTKGFTIHQEEVAQQIDHAFAEQPGFWSRLRLFSQVRFRAVAAFIVLSFAIVLPLQAMKGFSGIQDRQAQITDAGKSAVDHFMRGTQALESDRFDVAQSDFRRASKDFDEAALSLSEMNKDVSGIVRVVPKTDTTFHSVSALVDAGGALSAAAEEMALAAEEIKQAKSPTVVTKLQILKTYILAAQPEVEAASEALAAVDPSVLPPEYQENVTNLQAQMPALQSSMDEFVTFADTLTLILGENRKMRYLVTFQNNTELRPTGGFIGSFAEMDVLNGHIEQVHIPEGGTYDLQGQLQAFVEAPKPLGLINPRWEFHDANWFPDFSDSAQKLLWFYDQAGGPTVDGVIAINASMMPELLKILGPVDMPKYGRTITSENFLFETQKIVELEYAQYQDTTDRKEDAPKQFIGDLAPILLERIEQADMDQMLAIADVIGDGLAQKDVQLYFDNNTLQSRVEELGWAGVMKDAPQDYLMVVNTNLGGGKTDNVIDQLVDIDVQVAQDGTITNTVTITKNHRGLKTGLFEGKNNVDYIRLYVPKGSTLIHAEGFEVPPESLFETSDLPLVQDDDLALAITNQTKDPASETDIWEENGKTVFGNWMQTKPGEQERVSFTYTLPFTFRGAQENPSMLEVAKAKLGFKDLETYTLFLQKQSGVRSRETSVRISFPEGSEPVWSSHAGSSDTNLITLNNKRDNFLRFLVENRVER